MKNADDEFYARNAPFLAAISERVSDTDQMLSIVRTDPLNKGKGGAILFMVFLALAAALQSTALAAAPRVDLAFTQLVTVGQNGFTEVFGPQPQGISDRMVFAGTRNGVRTLYLLDDGDVIEVLPGDGTLPNGMGTATSFVAQYRMTPDGDILFRANVSGGSLAAGQYTFRWRNGVITVQEKAGPNFSYMTSDGRWLVEEESGTFPINTFSYFLTDGTTMEPLISLTGVDTQCHTTRFKVHAANANGVVAYSETKIEKSVCALGKPSFLTEWSIRLGGTISRTLLSGSFTTRFGSSIRGGTGVDMLRSILNDSNELLMVLETYDGVTSATAVRQNVVLGSSGGVQRVLFDTSDPQIFAFLPPYFDAQGRIAVVGFTGSFSGPRALLRGDTDNPAQDVVIQEGDPLFGSTLLLLQPTFSAVQDLAIPGENRGFYFTYELADGTKGIGLAVAQKERKPVIFLHGIAGSDLKVGSRKIWPSAFGSDVEDLALSPASPSAVAVDVVRDFAFKDYYGSFLSRMVSERGYVEYDLEEDRSRLTSDHMLTVSGAKPTLFTFPYDWRADNATHTATLRQYIQKIRQLHNNSKVNLVAHSMGGLVVRRYLLDYGTEDIDKVITVGSPLLGAVKPIYLLHSGDFYDNALDTVNSGKMKASLATMPGLHQLLPAPTFLANSPPVFAEAGIDLDRDFFTVGDYTDSQLVSTLKTLVAPTPSPMETNRTFHNFNGGKQDNWSGDVAGAIKFLHFVGIQQVDSTIVKVNATPYLTGVFAGTLPLLQRTRFVPVNGEGDGTVPILSSRRLPALLAPGTIIREIREPLAGVPSDEQPAGQAAEHTLLMSNLEVWAGIDEFLSTGGLPSASPAPAPLAEIPTALAAEAEAPPGRREISVIGAGYIKIRDLAGNTNAMVGDTAATRIPGVEARYGGSEPWVDLSFVADKHIILEGDPSTEPLDILVTEFDGTGTAKSMHRYRVIPDGHAWQMVLAPGTVPDLRLDLDDNANYSTGETVPPTFIREGAAVDTTAPTVTLTITRSGENIVMNLGGSDGTRPAPAVRYSMDGNTVQDYSVPLVFPRGGSHALKAFAEDGVGNTSGLIETTLNPALSVGSGPGGTINLEWPVSDGYVLEEALSLEGPWPISTITVIQTGLVNRASIPIGDVPKKFFRLRAIPVAR